VLLLFPDAGNLEQARKQEEKEAPAWEGDGVWWIKQTVRHPFIVKLPLARKGSERESRYLGDRSSARAQCAALVRTL
jgi:hypothetical protein